MALLNIYNFMTPQEYFNRMTPTVKKQYDALREFFHYGVKAEEVASRYGYTRHSFYWMVHTFKSRLETGGVDPFFQPRTLGRMPKERNSEVEQFMLDLRKSNYSCDDIVVMGQSHGYGLKYNYVYKFLQSQGFAPLYRRSRKEKTSMENPIEQAPRCIELENRSEQFNTGNIGILCFLPLIRHYGIDEAIVRSHYPGTSQMSPLSSILSVLALKLSNVKRYSKDDLWCMDRGSGLFAGLNVLPKTAWFSSYSDRVTREMNHDFLQQLHYIWYTNGLLSDTWNLDFTSIPYWGEEEPMENNWSGKRGKALASMLAVLAESPDSGLIDYGDTTLLHENQDAVVLEFLDFYKKSTPDAELQYLVFDSKFTNYENLFRLDKQGVHFITIRRRGKNILEEIESIPSHDWKQIKVDCAGGKKRTLKINDSKTYLSGYHKEIRQVIIQSTGREKPALIITNDFQVKVAEVVLRYAHRWLIEKTLSEQIEFFHLNRLSSSMVIKVDFDLTMSILAYNLYRLFASETGKYTSLTAHRIFDKLISNGGMVKVNPDTIEIIMKKKRSMPVLLTLLQQYDHLIYPWLHHRQLRFSGATTL
jgi:transposase